MSEVFYSLVSILYIHTFLWSFKLLNFNNCLFISGYFMSCFLQMKHWLYFLIIYSEPLLQNERGGYAEIALQKFLATWPLFPTPLHVVKSLTSNSGNVSLLEVMAKISKETKMKIMKMAKNTSSQAISKELWISRSKDQDQTRCGHPEKLQHRMVYRNWSEQQKIRHKKWWTSVTFWCL